MAAHGQETGTHRFRGAALRAATACNAIAQMHFKVMCTGTIATTQPSTSPSPTNTPCYQHLQHQLVCLHKRSQPWVHCAAAATSAHMNRSNTTFSMHTAQHCFCKIWYKAYNEELLHITLKNDSHTYCLYEHIQHTQPIQSLCTHTAHKE